ncbi:peptide ABC transporter permease [Halarchaeum grantii]|uniref:Peptide ABC transporter permease n=1 Tax=Halarchaeum grantii TaxID=1193105 RepID=A0A830FAE0_9EURY|nr:ABC transporter permease [Halarchaeum grantii]GGL35258.1 peptide ABC transporter permease [Halarchaeum grantii]
MSEHETVEGEGLRERVRADPWPAARWALVLACLLAVEAGALASFVTSWPWAAAFGWLGGVCHAVAAAGNALADLPTLLSRAWLDNRGYRTPDGAWHGTFMGLAPAVVWALRVALVYAYAAAVIGWCWRGYLVFRERYRYAAWTPTDDAVDRFRGHDWGRFGLVVVLAFVVLAVFAPTLGPTTVDRNIANPYDHQIAYYDGGVQTTSVGLANLRSASRGAGQNVGIGAYDRFGRFHPVGTLPSGKDLFTFMAAGARVSLFVGLLATAISAVVALALALLSAYYRGVFDLVTVLASDSVQAMPRLLVVIMLGVVLSGTWIAGVYSGALVLALVFGFWGWPGLWRAVRGPALQAVESDWVDAARSFGEGVPTLLGRHVAPFVVGYLLVYASMGIGGIMIGTAGLSYLGLGIHAPTPEWGRAVAIGQQYVVSPSWHISVLPGLAITLVVVGFNALGDGVRDAIDPRSEGDASAEAAATGGTR